MKTCPICHAVAFDDAQICFGCMYRYEKAQEEPGGPFANVDARSDIFANVEESCEPGNRHNAGDEPSIQHVIGGDDEHGRYESQTEEIDAADATSGPEAVCRDALGFVIKMVPVCEESGAIAWSCSVDLVEA